MPTWKCIALYTTCNLVSNKHTCNSTGCPSAPSFSQCISYQSELSQPPSLWKKTKARGGKLTRVNRKSTQHYLGKEEAVGVWVNLQPQHQYLTIYEVGGTLDMTVLPYQQMQGSPLPGIITFIVYCLSLYGKAGFVLFVFQKNRIIKFISQYKCIFRPDANGQRTFTTVDC